jgi:hypothetical protein
LLYSFATLLLAAIVELSAWPTWVNLTAAMVVVFFFVDAIAGYISNGARRDTVNQFENPVRGTEVVMAMLIAGESGGVGVIFTEFIVGSCCERAGTLESWTR